MVRAYDHSMAISLFGPHIMPTADQREVFFLATKEVLRIEETDGDVDFDATITTHPAIMQAHRYDREMSRKFWAVKAQKNN